jgi:recombination protein RecA
MPAAQPIETAEPIEVPGAAFPVQAETADPAANEATRGWDPALLAGRLIEITTGPGPRMTIGAHRSAIPSIWDIEPARRDRGSAALTAAAGLVWKAQHAGEPVAWIGARPSLFFPPDFAQGGIDLAALVVVRATNASSAARAADKLLRSGAFGLVVLDLGAHAAVPSPLLGRLLGLAQKHHAAVVFLTEKSADAPSLAPIVSLRVSASRSNAGAGLFACTIAASKDKRRAPGWTLEETFRGPPGLR